MNTFVIHCQILLGINDAPALTEADVGIALRSGNDIAFQSADIVSTWENLNSVPMAHEIGKLTLSRVRSNLLWAFGYNSIIIPIAAGVLLPLGTGLMLSPSMAAGAMVVSHVSVMMNSLLLKKAILRVDKCTHRSF